MAKPKKVKEVDFPAEETARWKRFKRDSDPDLDVVVGMLNARAAKEDGTRAAQVYDHLLQQLMSLYVSPAALERYRQGFTEEEINAIDQRHLVTAEIVRAEGSMMVALKSMAAAHPSHRQAAYDAFVEGLYSRWRWAEVSNGAGIEAMSADGVNVARE